jgi:hypothetical protein
MFLLNSIYNYRLSEPVWFRFFRGFFSITLTGLIIYYSITQFQKIGAEASIAIKFEYNSGKKKRVFFYKGLKISKIIKYIIFFF